MTFHVIFTVRIAESIDSSILFRNLFMTIFMLLNKRSSSAFELGRINRLIANVAMSLNEFHPEASLKSDTTDQNLSVM